MKRYKTIDLFAGIGGLRLGFEQTGKFSTIFSNDIDRFACDTYNANFKNPGIDNRDIWEVLAADELKPFDLLLAGFPCQAFSLAGGKKGFCDERGTLFFAIEKILEKYRPKAFLLENVKNLINHDQKKTFAVIKSTLEKKLKYHIFYKILNSADFGVPQNRERIYIVGFRKNTNFDFPLGNKQRKPVSSILEKKVSSKHYLSETYFKGLERHRKRQEAKGNGFGYNILKKTDLAKALVCGGMGRERNLIRDTKLKDEYKYTAGKIKLNAEGIRKLTPKECARLQGFPSSFKLHPSDTQAYRQLSNSVTVPVIKAIAERMYSAMETS